MHAWITSGLPHLGPILHVSYPSVEWLDHFATAPSKIINRVAGEYHLFAVGVRLEREVPCTFGDRSTQYRGIDFRKTPVAIFDFDEEFFETADAAANYAIERVISIISTGW